MRLQNLVRGQGLLCRSIMKSQMASPTFSHIYAALVAVINTKFPEFGELLLTRIILQFRRAYKRNDKPICIAASKFIGHLVNQQVRSRNSIRRAHPPGALTLRPSAVFQIVLQQSLCALHAPLIY